jgi:protein-S-isoprenylcysteine O-methyltransferase Ste14
MTDYDKSNLPRKAFWASTIFYGLIAFEFFYMFSPFAAYVYSVYGPGLDLLARSDTTTSSIAFFMPHLVRETSNFFINWHEAIGIGIVLVGLGAFLNGAAQVYWSKIKRRQTVQHGLYRAIRHPQYLALMVASFGMVLIWPRYLVLFGFVTVCFAYIWLARAEEEICRRKFPDYEEYKARTSMFLPKRIEAIAARIRWPTSRWARVALGLGAYVVALALSFQAASWLHDRSVASLYKFETENAVYLSLGRLERSEIARLAEVALADPAVRGRINEASGADVRFLNYVMPVDIFVSEIPMYLPEGRTFGHQHPSTQDQRRYKMIFTIADFGASDVPDGAEIIHRAINKEPVIEVWIDREASSVIALHQPPKIQIYGGIPVPVF